MRMPGGAWRGDHRRHLRHRRRRDARAPPMRARRWRSPAGRPAVGGAAPRPVQGAAAPVPSRDGSGGERRWWRCSAFWVRLHSSDRPGDRLASHTERCCPSSLPRTPTSCRRRCVTLRHAQHAILRPRFRDENRPQAAQAASVLSFQAQHSPRAPRFKAHHSPLSPPTTHPPHLPSQPPRRRRAHGRRDRLWRLQRRRQRRLQVHRGARPGRRVRDRQLRQGVLHLRAEAAEGDEGRRGRGRLHVARRVLVKLQMWACKHRPPPATTARRRWSTASSRGCATSDRGPRVLFLGHCVLCAPR